MHILTTKTAFCGDPPAAAQDEHLADRRELALVAVERTRMPMVVCDPRQPDDPIVLANQAFLDLTGYTSTEIIGRNCRFLQGPNTDAAVLRDLRIALDRGDDFIEVELLNYRKDGSTFANALDVSAVRNETGELLYYFASQKDVTAQRNAQALRANERRLLMEVDHRALNALELVNSLVSLSLADEVDSRSNSITGRVKSIAQAHQLLSESKWQPVDLITLFKSQIDSHSRHSFSFDGSMIRLRPHVVQPLGLVVHELFANAKRHGALNKAGGRVSVTWCCPNADLCLEWHEPLAVSDITTLDEGLGLQIVRSVVEQQLFGTFKIKFQKGLFEVSIKLPDAIVLAA